MEKAAIYLRISRDAKGEHEAWERQEPLCRDIAAKRNWEVVAVYKDEASASKRKVVRPDYERMRADWTAGHFEKVVVYDLDRFTRQGTELEQWILEATDENRPLHIASSNGDYELSHDNGQFFARMKAAVSAQETAGKARRQRDANRARAHNGKPPSGKRLYGFENDGVTVRRDEAAQVVRMFDLFSAGLTLRSISRELDRDGIPTRRGGPWSPSTIRGILSNPRCAGRTAYRGESIDVATTWEALVDEDVYDAVQAVLGRVDQEVPLLGG